MKESELRKILRSYGVGGFFGTGIDLLDEEYHVPHFAFINQEIQRASSILSMKGLSPPKDYAEDGADCDNWALWEHSEVTQLWALRHNSEKSYPALSYGKSIVKGHAITSAVTVEGLKVWDYSVHIPDWSGKILKLEYL